MPIINELVIKSIPFCELVPNMFLNNLSFKISELINVMSSKIVYKLLSIEENRFSKREFIVFIIISVIFIFVVSNLSRPNRLRFL